MNLITAGGEKLPIEVPLRIDVGRANERRENDPRRWIDHQDGGHELVPDDGARLAYDGESLGIEVASRGHPEVLPVVPGGIGDLVGHLDAGSVFPLDELVGTLEEGRAKIRGLGVLLELGIAVTVGERLPNAQALDVERLIRQVFRVPVVAQDKVLPEDLAAIGVVVKLHVGEPHAGDVREGHLGGREPILVGSRFDVRPAGVVLENVVDGGAGVVQQPDKVVILVSSVLCECRRHCKGHDCSCSGCEHHTSIGGILLIFINR